MGDSYKRAIRRMLEKIQDEKFLQQIYTLIKEQKKGGANASPLKVNR